MSNAKAFLTSIYDAFDPYDKQENGIMNPSQPVYSPPFVYFPRYPVAPIGRFPQPGYMRPWGSQYFMNYPTYPGGIFGFRAKSVIIEGEYGDVTLPSQTKS